MNLIANGRKLDRAQEKAIYELTLKKQRSKKSTVSHKQMAAMQQLANELISQRHEPPPSQRSASPRRPDPYSQPFRTTLCRCQSLAALEGRELGERAPPTPSEEVRPKIARAALSSPSATATPTNARAESEGTDTDNTVTSSSATVVVAPSPPPPPSSKRGYNAAQELQRQSSSSTIATISTSTSASSSSIASALSHRKTNFSSSFISSSTSSSTSTSLSLSDETNIKLNQLRLEQLNNELERRLHQYEYLVAQEKAILGTYNINLFTNESVNNFHLFRLDHKIGFP